jgi:hypothetical protein
MSAPEPGSRQRSPRLSRLTLAVAVAVVAAVLLAVGSSSVAHADPPPGSCPSFDGCIVVTPTSGVASADLRSTYWFIPDGTSCPYDVAVFSWDGKEVGSASLDPVDCSAATSFSQAPTSDTGGHDVGAVACSLNPSDQSLRCVDHTKAVTSYVVVPVPAIKVTPAEAVASAGFKVSYRTGDTTCKWAEAQVFWDGNAVGPRLAVEQTACRAVATFDAAPSPDAVGPHTVALQACARTGCVASTQAETTFTVLPEPTPSPSPRTTPRTTPRPTPLPSPTPSPTPSASPSPSPSLEQSASPSVPPSPSSTGEVLGATSPPKASASPLAAVAVPGPSPSGNPYVPALASFVGGPGPVDPAVIGTNILLTILVVFLFGLTAEIFNSTMDANRDEIHDWWMRLLGGPLAFVGGITFSGAGPSRLAGSGRLGSILRVLAILILSGLIYGFLSPDFGFNPQSLVLFISLVIGLGFITFYSEGSASRLARRRFRADASIRLYGTAVLVAIVAVIVSRAITLQPGFVYGFIASAVIIAPVALAKRDDATLVLVPAFGLLVVSILAWLLLGPVRVLAAGGSPLPALGETVLAMIVIGGLEGLFVTMIPLRFLDGATVRSWSFVGWILVFATVTFLWWQLLFNQDAAYAAAFEQTNVQVVLFTLGVFMLTTGGIWSYFRFRPAAPDEEPGTGTEAGSGG